jgi:fatty acid desaturase
MNQQPISTGQDPAGGRNRNPREAHTPVFPSWGYQVLVYALLLSQCAIGWLVLRGWYWLTLPLIFVAAHLMHGVMIGFHEASHSLLKRNRFFNELDGTLIGTFGFIPFTLFRVVHQTHHAHIASRQDEEFWPLVDTSMPRWARRLAAYLELSVALVYTPVIFFRAFFRKGSKIRNPRVRKRIWLEIALTIIVWTGIALVIVKRNLQLYFLFIYLLPAWLAANMQSWRKYVEHVGMTGSSINAVTRSIVGPGWVGRLMDFTLLDETYHGVHHKHPGLPHAELPKRTHELAPAAEDEIPPFRDYGRALLHMIPSLKDPHVGSQWKVSPTPSPANELRVVHS